LFAIIWTAIPWLKIYFFYYVSNNLIISNYLSMKAILAYTDSPECF
jgi:hypothetical protein